MLILVVRRLVRSYNNCTLCGAASPTLIKIGVAMKGARSQAELPQMPGGSWRAGSRTSTCMFEIYS